jgi:hypothetical protein
MEEEHKGLADESGVETAASPTATPLQATKKSPANAGEQSVAAIYEPPERAVEAIRTLPLSMVLRPATSDRWELPEARFPGELDGDFDSALARVEAVPASSKIAGSVARLMRWGRARAGTDRQRRVAFDGFTSALHDEKTERDRRYGTVYTVVDRKNAYLVRLELPRVLPRSALKSVWQLDRAMPDYDYSLKLGSEFLIIRGSVAGEALRRLSYVSASFPADFMTRIDFGEPIDGFVHRLRDKVIELIVFKRAGAKRSAAA